MSLYVTKSTPSETSDVGLGQQSTQFVQGWHHTEDATEEPEDCKVSPTTWV